LPCSSSFIAIKPDGVQRGLVGDIISRFEKRGFKLAAIKLVSPSKEHLEKHYEDLSSKPFFKGLVTCKMIPSRQQQQEQQQPHRDNRVLTKLGIRHGFRPNLRHGLGGS